jgi:hypothetical protein
MAGNEAGKILLARSQSNRPSAQNEFCEDFSGAGDHRTGQRRHDWQLGFVRVRVRVRALICTTFISHGHSDSIMRRRFVCAVSDAQDAWH